MTQDSNLISQIWSAQLLRNVYIHEAEVKTKAEAWAILHYFETSAHGNDRIHPASLYAIMTSSDVIVGLCY